jgi:hypothetical protein
MKRLLLPFLPTVFFGLILLFSTPPSGQANADSLDVTPLPPVSDPDGRLGMAYGFYDEPLGSGQRPYLDLMYDAGARHDRWDFSWWAIQPDHQEQWNWNGHEAIVRAENEKGVNVLGILEWTPQWASTYAGLTGWLQYLASVASAGAQFYAHAYGPLAPAGPAPFNSFPPKNLDEPVFVDGQINRENYWGYYVYNITRHFDGSDPELRVDAWEIWNEVEGAYFWSGSAQDYCQLLQVAYKAIKGEDGATGGNPNATVLFAGLHYWAKPNMYTQVLDCLAAADPDGAQHNYFFDVMSVHFYSRSDNTYHMVNVIRNGLATRGMDDHPIWLTETGAPLYGDASPGRQVLAKGDNYLSIDEEAAYVIQSYANALAAGVDRYYFFRAHDADMYEPHGLIRNDQSLRPAYVAYQVAAQYLRGENQATRDSSEEATRVNLWGTPQGKVSVLWNRTPNPVTYTLEAAMPTATLVDRWGVTQTVSAANGFYTLPLSIATANLVSDASDYIVGGDPLLLIETDTVSPTSELEPLPAINKGPVVTLTWTASDTPSGIWYIEIQASTAPDGPWSTVASLEQTEGTTQTTFLGQHGMTYYFRARARDRVGNWEAWPTGFEASTSVDTDTELHWQISTLFNDSNRNGEWDRSLTGGFKPEITLTQVSMRFVDEAWHTITATIGGAWHFTQTFPEGSYTFIAEWEDPDGDEWIYLQFWNLNGTVDPLYAPVSDTLGLPPRREIYFPAVRAGGR